MLAAVGLLLASLVLGMGTNLARALGDGNVGICGYSDLMKDAILANNGHTDSNYDCDDEYQGAGTPEGVFWGGSKGTADNAQDGPKDLDLANKGISAFKPGKGELDGFADGSRVDLRGNGLTTADLDLSDALKTFEDGTADAHKFVDTINGEGTAAVERAEPGLTFLLDGGSTSTSGLASATYSVTEGGIAWITFDHGNQHADFAKANANDGGAWIRVTATIEHDRADADQSSDVSFLINSKDADGTLYAVPFKFPDDIEIEKDKEWDIENVRLTGVGTFAQAVAANTDNTTFTAAKFDSSLVRNGDEAELTVIDNDTPPVLVSDRDDDVADAISHLYATQVNNGTSKSKKKMSIGDLERLTDNYTAPAGITPDPAANSGDAAGQLAIGKTNTGANNAEPISSISPADLSGLTYLNELDLSGNDLTELPSGLFAEVGSKDKADLSTEIILKGNDGPDGDGFFLSNLGPVGDELIAGQYLVVDKPKDDDSGSGFLNASYEGMEGGALVFDVNIKGTDATAAAGIQFVKTTGDTGALTATKDTDVDVSSAFVSLDDLAEGQYRIAIGLPENKKESGDNTLTAFFGHGADANATTLNAILSVAPVTIRDMSYMAPPPAPTSSFDSVVVTQNEYVEAPGNEDLKHNISNLTVTVGGSAVSANFLDVYNATGGLERWGYPTSELVEIPGIGLTQFFQRGALHLESNAEVTRLLAWDYVGGGMGGSTDQGVEAAPDSAPEGGEQVGAFGHYVANVDADGNATGFLDFFNRLGGVAAFGFPKTEAREDTGAEGTLMEPGTTAGFTRQYFQAAVFQLAEDGSVQLTLLGDTLRGILVPGYADMDAFGAADALSVGDSVSPPLIS